MSTSNYLLLLNWNCLRLRLLLQAEADSAPSNPEFEAKITRDSSGRFASKEGSGSSEADSNNSSGSDKNDSVAEEPPALDPLKELTAKIDRYQKMRDALASVDFGSDPRANTLKAEISHQIEAAVLASAKELLGDSSPPKNESIPEQVEQPDLPPPQKQPLPAPGVVPDPPAEVLASTKLLLGNNPAQKLDEMKGKTKVAVGLLADVAVVVTAGVLGLLEAGAKAGKSKSKELEGALPKQGGKTFLQQTLPRWGKLLQQKTNDFMQSEVAGYRQKFQQETESQKNRREKLGKAVREADARASEARRARQTAQTQAAGTELQKLSLPPLQSSKDIDDWSEWIEKTLPKLKNLDFDALEEIAAKPGIEEYMRSQVQRLFT